VGIGAHIQNVNKAGGLSVATVWDPLRNFLSNPYAADETAEARMAELTDRVSSY